METPLRILDFLVFVLPDVTDELVKQIRDPIMFNILHNFMLPYFMAVR
jgi:hypothetical protein